MDSQLIQKWMNSCRLCLLDDGVKLPIFGEEGIVREVAHKIQSCFPIVLYNADPLSKIICQRCLFMLDTVYSFREKCVETNSVFTSHLLALKSNSSSVKQYLQALEKSGGLPNSTSLVKQISKTLPVPPVREPRSESQKQPLVKSKVNNETIRKPTGNQSAAYRGNSDADPLGSSSEFHPPVVRIKQEGENRKKTAKSVPLIVSVVGSYSDNLSQNNTPLEISIDSNDVPETVQIKQEVRHFPGKYRSSVRQVCTPWHCKPCNKYYKSKGTLYKHKKYFCPSKYFSCGKLQCNEEFETKTERYQHWMSHLRVHIFLRPEQLFSCDICHKNFAYNDILMNHMKIHTDSTDDNGNDFQINESAVIGITSNRPQSLARSIAYKSRSRLKGVGGRRAYCEFCDRSYSRQTKLNWHKRICHKDEMLARAQYSENSMSTSASNDHTASNLESTSEIALANQTYRPGPLSKQKTNNSSQSHGFLRKLLEKIKCHVCLKNFNSQQGLSNHMRSHGPKKVHRCLTCGRVFGSKKGLIYHTKTKHGGAIVPQDSYRCRPCSRSFKSRSEWLLHTLTHDKNKKEGKSDDIDPLLVSTKLLLCSYCNQVFSQSSELKAHMMTHKVATASAGTTPPISGDLTTMIWPCEICTKEFTKKRNLVRHMKIHEKRMHSSFPCHLCGKKFLSKASALKHAAVHSLSKTFHCDVCNKIFFKIEALHNHLCTPGGSVQTTIEADLPTSDLPMEALPFDILPLEGQLRNQFSVKSQPQNCLSCGFTLTKGHKCQYYQRDGTVMPYQVKSTMKSKVPHKRSSYRCRVCGVAFASYYSHNSHMKVHKKKHILKVPSLIQENATTKFDSRNSGPKFVSNESMVNEASSSADCGTFIPLDLRRLTVIDAASSSVEERNPASVIPEFIPPSFSADTGTAGLQYLPPSSYYNHDSTLFDENEFYQCSICTKTFHSEQGLSLHIRSHEGPTTKVSHTKITCPFCSRNYADTQAINQHILLNHPELSGIKE